MKLFISYSSKDAEIIYEYRNLFEKAGYQIWMAPYSIPLGESYAEAIPVGIEWCEYFLIFVSRNSLCSKWCRSEIDNAKQKSKKIIPIFIDDVEYTEAFRFYLNDSQGIYYNAYSSNPSLNIERNILPYLEKTKPQLDPLVIQYNEKLAKKTVIFNKVFTSLDLKIENENHDSFSNFDLMFDIYGDDLENEFNLESLINESNRFIVHGEAGCGKTTILKKIVIDAANYCLKNNINALPVFLELSKIDSPDSLFTEIYNTIGLNEDAIKDTHLIIVLDGLDEYSIDSEEKRNELVKTINNLYTNHSSSIVIGCRTNVLPKQHDYKLVKIKPLTEGQSFEFIHKYFGYFSISIDERDFYTWLKRITNGVSITPLLLSIAIGLNKSSAFLTSSIDDLYKAYITKLLSKICANKTATSLDEYFYLSSKIAFEMLIRSKTSILLSDAIADCLTDTYTTNDLSNLIKDISSSELISINDNAITFIHASIMEYLGQTFASREFDFVPKEAMDQYFLKDKKLIDKINNVLKIKEEDVVMEVGAGIGSVASSFPKCQKLYLVDLDEGLSKILNYNFRKCPYAEVINGDALVALKNIKCNKVVSNLPFFLTHEVLSMLTALDFEVAVMSVKKEDTFKEFEDSLLILELANIPGTSFYPVQPFDSKLIMVRKIR